MDISVDDNPKGNVGSEAIPEDILFMNASPPTQVLIESRRILEINPHEAYINSNSIIFYVKTDLNEYMDVHSIEIIFAVKLKKLDGTDYTNDAADVAKDITTLANGPGSSLFKNVRARLNNIYITKDDNCYAYHADIETKLFTTGALKEYGVNLSGTYFDYDKAAIQNQKLYNKLKQSQTVYFISKIHLPIFDQPLPLPPSTVLQLEFEKMQPDWYYISNNNKIEHKLELSDFRMYVPILKGNPSAVNEQLEITKRIAPYIYPLRRVQIFSFTRTTNDFSIANLFPEGNILPRRIFITFLKQKAFLGDLKSDPFKYENFNFESCELVVGGEIIPYPRIKNFTEAYYFLEKSVGCNFEPGQNNAISIDNYVKKFPIFGWDLSPVATAPLENYTIPNYSTAQFNCRVRDDIREPVTILVYAEFEAELTIDIKGNVAMSDNAV